jgi:hypothetical protein
VENGLASLLAGVIVFPEPGCYDTYEPTPVGVEVFATPAFRIMMLVVKGPKSQSPSYVLAQWQGYDL